MKISTRARYATCALITLAESYGKKPVSLRQICKEQSISLKYLENIMRLLVPAGIVKSTKGKGGGFVLGKDPKKIKMSEVVNIAEGVVMPIHCIAEPSNCPRFLTCPAKYMWKELQEDINISLDKRTLSDLMKFKAGLAEDLKKNPSGAKKRTK